VLPLVATSARAGQINAQLPYNLPVDETLQIEVRRGDELSMPEPFVVAAAQPGIFTENQSGSGQGIIVKSIRSRWPVPSRRPNRARSS